MAVVGAIGLLTGLAMLLLWPGAVDTRAADTLGLASDVYAGRVERVTTSPCRGTTPEDGVACTRVRVRLLAGPDEGDRRTLQFPVSPSTPDLVPGDEIVLTFQPDAGPRVRYAYSDRQRREPLLLLAVLFVVAVVALARVRAASSLSSGWAPASRSCSAS